jgi:hypothetical protein
LHVRENGGLLHNRAVVESQGKQLLARFGETEIDDGDSADEGGCIINHSFPRSLFFGELIESFGDRIVWEMSRKIASKSFDDF